MNTHAIKILSKVLVFAIAVGSPNFVMANSASLGSESQRGQDVGGSNSREEGEGTFRRPTTSGTRNQPTTNDGVPEDIISDACDGEYILIFGPDGTIEEWDCA